MPALRAESSTFVKKTDLRQLVRLVYHAQGVLGPGQFTDALGRSS